MARRSYGRLPPLPKPYDFVDISPLERDDRRHPTGHDRYHPDTLSGRLTGQLTALSPVHVASGLLEMTGRRDVPLVKAHVRSAGRPVIPGSSFKGAIRSIVEAISRSCVRVTRARRNQLPRDADGCRNPRRLCVACRMFGSLGFQGNVRFSDAVLREDFETEVVSIPALYAPRSREQLYYREGKAKGRKFYQHGTLARGDGPVEVCPIGSIFNFTLHFENLTEGELGLLLVALGQGDPVLTPKLGGGKPVCAGSVRVTVGEVAVVETGAEAYMDYDLPPATPAERLGALVRAAEALVVGRQLQQLAEILRVDEERDCPDRNY